MSLFRQTVTVRPMTRTAGADGVLGPPTLGSPVAKKVAFETSPQGVDFSEYGVSQAHGARLFCKLADRDAFAMGSEVTWLGDEYTVLSLPAPMQGGTLAHAQVLLQRITEEES